MLTQRPHELEPAHPRHVAVGGEQVGRLLGFGKELERLPAVFGLLHLVAQTVELRHHDAPHRPVVAHDHMLVFSKPKERPTPQIAYTVTARS